jgi:hypothetical protein
MYEEPISLNCAIRLLSIAKKFSKMIVSKFQRIARPLAAPLASRVMDWPFFQIYLRMVSNVALELFVYCSIKIFGDSVHTLFCKIHFLLLPLIPLIF